jgi:DNA invertase Pin-like site-specific DNA recombinase
MAKNKSKKNGTAKPASNGTPTKRTRKDPYPYELFVKIWAKAAGVAEVVQETGLSKNTVSAICTKLRKEGVELKTMPRRTARPIDVKALNKLIKETGSPKSATA